MNRIVILLKVLVICLMVSCSQGRTDIVEAPLFKEELIKKEVKKFSDLFKHYRLIQLETNDSCLLGGGRGVKAVKFNSSYYVLSQNAIYQFNKEGKFVKSLDKRGGGPEEYSSIFDFDVISYNAEDELWISVPGLMKIYDVETFGLKRTVVGPQYVHQFEVINDSTIMAVTPEDTTFKILRGDGSVRKSFMKMDISASAYKFQQFFSYNNQIIYQLDDTETGVIYDIERDSFYFQKILYSGDELLTLEACKNYYEQYGYMSFGIKIAEDFIRLSSIATLGDNVFFVKMFPNGTKELLAKVDGKDFSMIYAGDDVKVHNDLFNSSSLLFLSTMTACKSDDSFLFLIPVSMLNIEGIEEDDNYWLFEVEC